MAEETSTTGQVDAKSAASRGRRRQLTGRIVNDTSAPGRTKKTVVIEVIRRFRDPFYGKYVKKRTKYHAHDENEQYKTRDLVEIRACRPRSKTKRWEVVRLIDRPQEV